MEYIEEKVQKRVRRERIQNIVLTSLYGLFALGLSVAAPNTTQLLKHVEKRLRSKHQLPRRMHQAIQRLHARGLVELNTRGIPRLTKKGEHFARSLDTFENIKVSIPKKWDGRWRIIIFDVWERRRNIRDRLRNMLENVGFVRIQDSVWVYPYPCEELLVLLRSELHLGEGILYIVAEDIENDRHLRTHFHLQ